MKRLYRINAAALLLCALVGYQPTAAADGFYFGGGSYLSEASTADLDDTDNTLAFFVGYTLIDSSLFMLSAELGSYDLGEYSENNVEVDADAIGLSATATLPLGPFIELYGRAGIAEVDVSVNGDDFDGSENFVGAGISLDFFDTVDIYLEYLEFDNEVDSNLLGVGIKLDLL